MGDIRTRNQILHLLGISENQLQEAKRRTSHLYILNISNAMTAYTHVDHVGVIDEIEVILTGAITVDDAVLTSAIDGTPVTGGDVTIDYTTSGAGAQYESEPTAANAFDGTGQTFTVTSDGGSTGAVIAHVILHMTLD